MSEGFESQPEGAPGAAQTGAPTETAPGARMDIQGAVPTDFTGPSPGPGGEAEIKTRVEGIQDWIENTVRRNPLQAIFVCMLVGFAFSGGTRARAHRMRKMYFEPALHRTEGALLTRTLALGALFRMLWRSATTKAHSAYDAALSRSKPLVKASRRATHRFQRRMHSRPMAFFWR